MFLEWASSFPDFFFNFLVSDPILVGFAKKKVYCTSFKNPEFCELNHEVIMDKNIA